MTRGKKTGFLLFFSFLGLIGLYFGEALFQPNLMVERDLSIFFFPQIKLWVETVLGGELPLWNPYSLSGQPLFASLQTGILYPPNLLLLILPLEFAFNLTIALHFFLAGWFVYLLCRELGGSRTAGVLSCLSFTLGGVLLSLHNVQNTLQSAAWIPLLLFFSLKATWNPGWKYSVFIAITVLIQFLGGGIEIFLLTQVLVVLLMVNPKIISQDRDFLSWKNRIKRLIVAYLLFSGLGAVQIIPFLEMAFHSIRSSGLTFQEATRWSLEWSNLLYVFLPDFFWRGVEYYKIDQNYLKSIYLGIIPFVSGFFFFSGTDRRKLWWGGIIVFSTTLALGGNTPLYRILFYIIPGIQTIRYPAKFFLLANLFVCLVTGLGWDVLNRRLEENPLKKQGTLKKAAIILALLSALFLLGLTLFRGPLTVFLEKAYPISYARPWSLNFHNLERFSIFALLTFLFFVFLGDRKITARKGARILVILLTLDLFLANWGFYGRMERKAYYTTSPTLKAVLSNAGNDRIYIHPSMLKLKVTRNMEMQELVHYFLKECLLFEYPLIHKIHNAAGFGVLTYQPYQDLLTILTTKNLQAEATDLFRIMNVRCLLWPEGIEGPSYRLLHKGEPYVMVEDPPQNVTLIKPPHYREAIPHLYLNQKVLPGAFLVPKYMVVKNRIERMQLLAKKAFDPAQTVLLEERPEAPKPFSRHHPKIELVNTVRRSANKLEFEVSCPEPRILFLSETYYPGWKVRVNGEEKKIYRANHAFRALPLSPGRYKVIFSYEPFSVKLGFYISLATLLGSIGLTLVIKGKKKGQR